jgi:hypothetical protein
MKNPCATTRSLLLIFFLALSSAAMRAQAQLSDVPPVSMGLWQTETTSTVSGVENTPMAGMAAAMGRSHVTQSCLTPDKWESDIQGLNARQQHGCTLSNLHQDAHEVSFDEACTSERGGATTAHIDILIDSSDHTHGTVLMKIANPALPQPMTMTMTMISQHMGASCGDVKPGEGKMIR